MARIERRFDFSGAIQTATSWILRKPNEVEDAINARFNHKIGAVTRRDGYTTTIGGVVISAIQANKAGLGLHEAKFASGAKIFGASNNVGDTETVIKSLNTGTGAWTSLTTPAIIAAGTHLRMIDSLGEMYVAGKAPSGNRIAPFNVKSDLSTSATRNLVGCPDCAFLVEYGGALYAINVKFGGTVYPDRAYRSSPAMGVITFVRGVQVPTSTSSFIVNVDSVKYLKTNLAVDFYKAGTETAMHSNVTPSSVDKNLNTITITPRSDNTIATTDVDAATDTITVTIDIPTGTPIAFSTTTTMPAPLVAGTIYYAIRQSATTIKVATSYANAIAGTAIDITSTGTGTHTVYQGVNDNDEIWGASRKNELAYYWNTDYPTQDTADFLRIPPGVASDAEITSYAKTNNRLYLYTKSSTHKWDNANLVDVYQDVGCISHETVQNIRGWIIWLTADGEVYARNDATGQDNVISEAMRNDYLEALVASNLSGASAGVHNRVYKLYLGSASIKGADATLNRFCYDFRANSWTRETHARGMARHLHSDFAGSMKLFFLDDTAGKFYQDETGNLDDTDTIPFLVRFGRSNDGSEQLKAYQGFYVHGSNSSGASFKVFVDRGDPMDIGQLEGIITRLPVPNGVPDGRDIDFEITQNSDGAAIEIEGVSTYYDFQEDKFG